MKVVVIGAGASGLVSAIELAKNNDVTILEKLETSAKKILVTGNGRCNYWNEDFGNKHFYSTDTSFIEKVNTEENRKMVLNFFENIGIVPMIKNGYYYPMSMQASSLRSALLKEIENKNIKIINNSCVKNIKKENDKFYIQYNNEEITSDVVVIATGSNSYYKEQNLGYNLCKNLGHNIIKVMPSLVQLIGKGNYFKEWAGARNVSKVNICIDKKIIKEEYGEVMFTDYGLSGICIFNLSGIANRALDKNNKVTININFLPTINNLYDFLEERGKKLNNRKLDEFLEGLLNYKLIKVILNRCMLDKNNNWNNLKDDDKRNLVNMLSNFEVEIISSKSFDSSQVCTGGVDTKEVNPLTMESRIVKNLYIVGEVLDVDGECGGYNLGFAFLSGMIAGRSVNND